MHGGSKHRIQVYGVKSASRPRHKMAGRGKEEEQEEIWSQHNVPYLGISMNVLASYQKNVIQLLAIPSAGHTACFYVVVCCNVSFNTLKIISFRTSTVAWYLGTDKITTVFRGRGRSPFSGKIFVCLVWPDRRNVSQPLGCPQVESSLRVRTHAHRT